MYCHVPIVIFLQMSVHVFVLYPTAKSINSWKQVKIKSRRQFQFLLNKLILITHYYVSKTVLNLIILIFASLHLYSTKQSIR